MAYDAFVTNSYNWKLHAAVTTYFVMHHCGLIFKATPDFSYCPLTHGLELLFQHILQESHLVRELLRGTEWSFFFRLIGTAFLELFHVL